jgi:hypothetical protein
MINKTKAQSRYFLKQGLPRVRCVWFFFFRARDRRGAERSPRHVAANGAIAEPRIARSPAQGNRRLPWAGDAPSSVWRCV